MAKSVRADKPRWLSPDDVAKLIDFVTRHGGTLRIHNHAKTIERW